MRVSGALAAALASALVLGGCGRDQPDEPQRQPGAQQQRGQLGAAGVTPMAERVAVIGLLNKRNGIVRNLTMKPGQAVRVKDAIVRLRACETTAPWENEKLTGAFVQLDVQRPDESWGRVFSGWLYKETPSLNVVEHPVYDVWPRSCAMTFPGGTPPPGAPAAASSNRSSARNSGGARPAPSAPAAEPEPADDEPAPPSAADSNAT
jgi:hypothetical protein